MAIDASYFKYLRPVLRSLMSTDRRRIACLSYPDILMSPEEIVSAFPEVEGMPLTVRPDSDKICRWHGLTDQIEITETASLFDAIGFTADFFDVAKIRGSEIVVDLNESLDLKYQNDYDLVIDTGTLEHCFNVGNAIVNMCKLVRPNGILITQAPMSKMNHGFWNFSPCAYHNFFTQNRWKIYYIEAYGRIDGVMKSFHPEMNSRFLAPPESIIIACAQKLSDSTTKFPVQQKYLNML